MKDRRPQGVPFGPALVGPVAGWPFLLVVNSHAPG